MPRATSCFKICPPSATSCLLKRKYGQLRSVYIRAGLVYVWRINSPSRVAAARRRLHKQCRLCAGTGMIRGGCYTTLILTAFYDPPERRIHLPIRHWRACIPLIRWNCERCFFFFANVWISIYFTYPIFPSEPEIGLICIFINITEHTLAHTYILQFITFRRM